MERTYRGVSTQERLDKCRAIAKEKGGECLSVNYVNTKTKLEWKCSKGHVWKANPINVVYKGKWCPECSGNKKLTINHAIDLAIERGGVCLSSSYKNSSGLLDWKCKFGHQWSANYNNVKRGSWCPYCVCLFGETVVRIHLERYFESRFVKTRPSWLNGLELDGYAKNLGIAFEYNGPQHSDKKHIFYDDSIIVRDAIKRKLCEENGVILFDIDYVKRNEISEIQKAVNKSLNDHGFESKAVKIDESQIYPYKIEECRLLAKERGGECLSDAYLGYDKKLKWKCGCGNVWKTTMYIINKGHWCPRCAYKRNK